MPIEALVDHHIELKLGAFAPPDKRPARQLPRRAADRMPKMWSGTLPDKFLAVCTSRVSATSIRHWVEALSAFHSRHSYSTYLQEAAEYLLGQFQALGYGGAELFPYVHAGHSLCNVIATKTGTAGTGKTFLICAHFDSLATDVPSDTGRAPGADDNASGVAGLLEIARILAEVDVQETVVFAAFSGEEQGYLGSSAYAAHLAGTSQPLGGLINLDMIGYPPEDRAIVVERDQGNASGANDAASVSLGQLMAQMATDYTTLPVQLGEVYGSDYMPFEALGYVVAGAYEAGHNPHYHRSTDVPETVDCDYAAEVTRMVLATVLHETVRLDAIGQVDVYIRDSASDAGDQPSPTPHWESPDIWVRNLPPPDPGDASNTEDPEAGHQPPLNDVPNFLYVRVHNRGAQAASGLQVRAYHCDPGTAMMWPGDFHGMGVLNVPDSVPPGGSLRVGPFVWTPHILDHECLLAVVSGPEDRSVVEVYHGTLEHSLLVRYDNNVGQRNVSPQLMTPGGSTKTAFVVSGAARPSSNTLSLDASTLPPDTEIRLRLARKLLDRIPSMSGLAVARKGIHWGLLRMAGGTIGRLEEFLLEAGERRTLQLEIDFSLLADHSKRYTLVVGQKQDGRLAGRLSLEIQAVKDSADYVYGNRISREVHRLACPFRQRMRPRNQVPFQDLQSALDRGFDGCAHCLGAFSRD